MTNRETRPQDAFDDQLDAEPREAPPNPLLLLHRRLRGRYLLAGALAALFGAPGAIVGWHAMQVQYESVGQVEVRLTMPKIMYDTPENQMTPFFAQYVQNEVTYITLQRTLTRAAADPALRAGGWPAPPEGTADLQAALSVAASRLGSTIAVRVAHTDPRLAQLAVNAVLRAYKADYEERNGQSATVREDALQRIVTDLQNRLIARRNELFTLSNNLGAETLPRRFETKTEELARYDALLTSLDLAIVEARTRQEQTGESGADEFALEELALRDGALAGLLAERDGLVARQRSLEENLLPNHRSMRELARQISEVESRISMRAEIAAQQAPGDTGAGAALTLDEMLARRERHEADRNRISAEANDLASKLRLVEATRTEIDDIEQRLADASGELNAVRVERENRPPGVERVEVIEGDAPLRPAKDKRLPLAVAGAGAGIGLGVGLVFLYGLARPTYRFIDDVEAADGIIPLLGTLPDFSSGDPEQRDLAALSVHHLRNALQLRSGRAGGRVVTVTSGAAGDGKTSLVMALATSFAAAGQRTCMVDADLIGRGLTRELRMSDRDGFVQAVESGPAEGMATSTAVKSLWIIPAGRAGSIDSTRLSEQNVRPLIESLRQRFDVVLIDTGPLLGSLEANIVARLSDSVVLAVSRGQGARIVKAALERMKRIGAPCAGIVFNRAAPVDFRSSVSHASIRSTSIVARPGEEERMPRPGSRASLMDAVAGVVLANGDGEA